MLVLGISAYYHDSAAALLRDGHIVAAAAEERFTRKKHCADFPTHALAYCLKEAGATLEQIDYIVFYDKPLLKFERLLETYLTFAPRGFRSFRFAMPQWLREKLFLKRLLRKKMQTAAPGFDWDGRLLFSEHHLSHAASAFFPSPFDEAAVLTLDGVGEWATTSLAIGKSTSLTIEREIHYPHSLGLLYSAFTAYTGFKVNSGEYKVMGLAPYGQPKYVQLIYDHLIDVKNDGSFRLNMHYFDYCVGPMTNSAFAELFGGAPRDAEDPLTQRDMDLAASIQVVTDEVLLRLTRSIASETGLPNLCLAGGVALNCVGNGQILRDGRFKKVWVQPAAGDEGCALGAALAAYHIFLKRPRVAAGAGDKMQGAYLGPGFTQHQVEQSLHALGARFSVLTDDELLAACAADLAAGKALGWFQGRMEFGPRALGARSILADPRSPSMQKNLNIKVKFRESFRPFAPAVLREDVADWFELDGDSPYMQFVVRVAADKLRIVSGSGNEPTGLESLDMPRSEIPATTHVDYTARVQTVHSDTNPRFHALLSRFKHLTGCPVLVNTSFNVRGEPIVCTPEDAFRCFMGTDIDTLAIGNCLLSKNQQNEQLKVSYKGAFGLD